MPKFYDALIETSQRQVATELSYEGMHTVVRVNLLYDPPVH